MYHLQTNHASPREPMSALILDTSTDCLYLRLVRDHTVIAGACIPHENQLSRLLVPSIHSLLQENGVPLKDLSYIACGTGPGSFTGTRIGAIVSMSLSFALDIPSLGFPSSFIGGDPAILIAFLQEKFEKKSYSLEITYS